ncbi:MAG: alpha/beta hydrolase [Thermoguttaceae bacterium]|nr:alpha/beta hydrolase [Thermoguttaceae bacterium]
MNKTFRIVGSFLVWFFILTSWSFAASGSSEPFQTKAIKDVVYKKVDGRELKMNLFLPTRNGEPLVKVPVLVHIDSGCWYSDQPGDGGLWRTCKGVEKGNAVVSVAHRSLKDGYVFPAQIEDVKAAIRFLRAHAKDYGLDPDRIAVLGASSGGHLACMLGIPGSVKDFDVGENLEYSSQVQRVINFYSVCDMYQLLKNHPFKCVDCLYLVLGAKKNGDKPLYEQAPALLDAARKYSPATYISKDFSPTLTLQGVKDKIVPCSQSALLYEYLTLAGVRSELYMSNAGVHGVKSIASEEVLEKLIFDFLQWDHE